MAPRNVGELYLKQAEAQGLEQARRNGGQMETGSEKQQAHDLIERLEPSQISMAVRFLEFMLLDPVARALATAPPDDEEVTDQDRRRVRDGQAWLAKRGSQGIPMEDVLADFGLKAEDFPSSPENAK
jgi:hypothetical protein